MTKTVVVVYSLYSIVWYNNDNGGEKMRNENM